MNNTSNAVISNYKKPSLGKRIKKTWQLWVFVLPALIGLIIFSYVPMYGIVLAWKDYSPIQGIMGSRNVGFAHFERFFRSPYFVDIIRNTIVISLYGMVVGFPIPILLALGLNQIRNLKFKKFIQTVTYAPYFISTVVLVGIINIVFAEKGFINQFISMLGNEPVLFMGKYQILEAYLCVDRRMAEYGLECHHLYSRTCRRKSRASRSSHYRWCDQVPEN